MILSALSGVQEGIAFGKLICLLCENKPLLDTLQTHTLIKATYAFLPLAVVTVAGVNYYVQFFTSSIPIML